MSGGVRDILHLTRADARSVPWKNGKGVTHEVAIWPAGASLERGDFDWRVSIAGVPEAGPFSVFPGCDRWLVVTEGAGLLLTHERRGERTRAVVEPLQPHHFEGEWPTAASLLGGAVTDFNVIFKRGRVRAGVQVLEPRTRGRDVSLESGHTLLHVVQGGASARLARGGGEDFELAAGETLWVRDAQTGETLHLQGSTGGCVALLVQIENRGDAR